ncbi:Ribonuclease III [Invertebrate iridescent virus 30]|uniref:Ribonuclease III n=1 Tax=Invertebrate iridescent virus 30 TaxID=345585 RepID=W8W1T4_9VIRU|nr:Ribonuclease III [Invertebrate iridescent virus 30]CCV02318.1 Ribonuclease III [Invertebrate iridescent virus 30]
MIKNDFFCKKNNLINIMNSSNISKINLYCQKLRLNPPYFETLKKEGKDHSPKFQVSCTFEKNIEIGEGLTLKSAKEDAASKIVELLGIDLKLNDLEKNIHYTVDSYNVPLADIWDNVNKEYTLTLRKKEKNNIEFKNFKVKIIQILD